MTEALGWGGDSGVQDMVVQKNRKRVQNFRDCLTQLSGIGVVVIRIRPEPHFVNWIVAYCRVINFL